MREKNAKKNKETRHRINRILKKLKKLRPQKFKKAQIVHFPNSKKNLRNPEPYAT